jgi:hypothetical protein
MKLMIRVAPPSHVAHATGRGAPMYALHVHAEPDSAGAGSNIYALPDSAVFGVERLETNWTHATCGSRTRSSESSSDCTLNTPNASSLHRKPPPTICLPYAMDTKR